MKSFSKNREGFFMSNYVYEEPTYYGVYVQFTSEGGTKSYDGSPLVNGTVAMTDGPRGGIYDPHRTDYSNCSPRINISTNGNFSFRTTGSQTAVGSSFNTIEVDVDAFKKSLEGRDLNGNVITWDKIKYHDIRLKEGKLIVNMVPIPPSE